MRYLWDCFRWRFVAAFYIAWWFVQGAPMTDWEPYDRRWEVTKTAWRMWRASIMYPHEKDQYVTVQQWIANVREELDKREAAGKETPA